MNKQFGILIMLLSTISYAVLGPLMKLVNKKIQPFTLMSIMLFFLFLFSLILSIIFEKSYKFKFLGNINHILILALVGAINTLGFWLMIESYKYMSIWQQSLFSFLTPIIAGIFAYFILGETLNVSIIFSLILMGLGLAISLK